MLVLCVYPCKDVYHLIPSIQSVLLRLSCFHDFQLLLFAKPLFRSLLSFILLGGYVLYQSLSLIYQYFWTPRFHASYGLLTVELHFHALFRIKSLTVALSCFPPVMGRLVLQLLIVYDSSSFSPFNSCLSILSFTTHLHFHHSIHVYLFYLFSYSPSDRIQRDAETIVISLCYISRRQRRCSFVSKQYQQPQLLINFVSIIMLGMIRFPSQIIQPCEAYISMQAQIAMYHFTCMVPYIVCPAYVCDGTAQVTLGNFTLYNARYNS